MRQILESHGITYNYDPKTGKRTMTKDGQTLTIPLNKHEVYKKLLHVYGINEPKLKTDAGRL